MVFEIELLEGDDLFELVSEKPPADIESSDRWSDHFSVKDGYKVGSTVARINDVGEWRARSEVVKHFLGKLRIERVQVVVFKEDFKHLLKDLIRSEWLVGEGETCILQGFGLNKPIPYVDLLVKVN